MRIERVKLLKTLKAGSLIIGVEGEVKSSPLHPEILAEIANNTGTVEVLESGIAVTTISPILVSKPDFKDGIGNKPIIRNPDPPTEPKVRRARRIVK